MNIGQPELRVPPSTNRGAQNTETQILIDWVAFTLPDTINPIEIASSLFHTTLDEFLLCERGMLGYQTQYRLDNMVILTDGKQGMGTHVILSGSGCRLLESSVLLPNGLNWRDWLSSVLSLGAKFTRCDIAIDEFSGVLNVHRVADFVRSGLVRTRFRKPMIQEGISVGNGVASSDGVTVYFGSPQSKIRVRFYDKAAEQSLDTVWNRCELQTRDSRSQALVNLFCNGLELGSVVRGVLASYIAFVDDKSSDSNFSRRSVVSWWDGFLLGVSRLKLTIPKSDKSIDDILSHFSHQYAPLLGSILSGFGDFESLHHWIDSVARIGIKRMKSKHFILAKSLDESRILSNLLVTVA
ncbi:replication initiation factor domain-containing protein [Alicyclobacillus tolerans]|uniref:Phage replication initiation protein n=1 Tax=Alicyclobacillus tolerans TaxID=90970 RepID=A0A1M6MM46_9BACL|nr:replication initiation factor domain-containing protein [Alicyclobacillus montanus]SHJ84363.1 phage replication initiation protein [Alicyclobacillus montanus]